MPLRAQFREELYHKFVYYRQMHFSDEKLESTLLKAGLNEDELLALRGFLALQKKIRRHQYGLALTVAGSIILVVGFVWTAVLYHQNPALQGVMYGFTGFGLVLLLMGIYFLF